MEVVPQIFTAEVMHKRLFPKRNRFKYSVYYIVIPLRMISDMRNGWRFGVNRKGVLSLWEKDYGARDGSALEPWARRILSDYGLLKNTHDIILVTMPRVLGYGFNPVSFWLCLDEAQQLRAVISEVHNTFGEAHSYLCAHPDHRPITQNDWLHADKLFHVSPFLPREGSYDFRFALKEQQLGVWIDYKDAAGDTQLITSMTGRLQPLTPASLRRVFWTHPLVTLKTIMLIHWQALKLFAKGVRYRTKPPQREEHVSATTHLTKL